MSMKIGVFSRARAGRRLIHLGLCLSFAAMIPGRAVAGSCSANDTYANVCKGHYPDCGSSSSTCVVRLTYSGTVAADPDPICVARGTKIQWVEATATYRFTAEFANSPFKDKKTSFSGASGKPTEPDSISTSAKDCYAFTAVQCDNATSCHANDPRVIVNPGP